MKLTVLVVEDDTGMRESLNDFFSAKGCGVFAAENGAAARAAFSQAHVDLVILDLALPDISGMDLLREFRSADEKTTVVVITANLEVDTAVRAMKLGAYDYITKPFDLEEMRSILGRVRDVRDLKSQVDAFQYERARRREHQGLLGDSPPMHVLRDLIVRAAAAPHMPVLILGETGSGKELVAEAIHEQSGRHAKPITKLNCSAIPSNLIESELFGYERGAFTDARMGKPGVFELADGGTLFLDELGDLQLDVQPKLLRVLDGHSFRRVGGTRDIRSDVRIVAATNRDLQALTKQGRFREDLYYRLSVMPISVPPLRERADDVIRLAQEFLRRAVTELRRGEKRLSAGSREVLLRYRWPGNVRELRNVIERCAILCDDETIEPRHLPPELEEATAADHHHRRLLAADDLSLEAIERAHILHVVEQVGWNKSEAARRLGISRNALKEKLKRFGFREASASDPSP